MGISTKNIREVEAAIKTLGPEYSITELMKITKVPYHILKQIKTKYLNNQENKTNGNH